jgi:hypothetical protein
MQTEEPAPEQASIEKLAEIAAAPASRLGPPYVFGASVIGPLHVQMGIPCQDACAYEACLPGMVTIAVADGLGSAPKSELGARLAVAAAVQKVREMLKTEAAQKPPLSEIIRAAFLFARQRLEDKAVEEGCSLRDLACTLIVVVSAGGGVAAGHVGDGGVVAQASAVLSIVSGPGESEYANEVTPLTSEKWIEALRVAPDMRGVQCLAVFTDGCQRAAFLKSSTGLQAYGGFFGPIFSYSRELTSVNDGEEDIKSLLASKKICDNSEDDKTLVIAVLTDGKSASV